MRDGKDARLPPELESGRARHTYARVHVEMLLQVARDYSGLPDVRTLTASEIRFFYDGLRHDLRELTKPKK